jgi:Ribbon-helix-helix protein, copG family
LDELAQRFVASRWRIATSSPDPPYGSFGPKLPQSRQAYRYIEEARLIGRPVPVVETATAVTFKLPPSLVDAVRARAAAEGATISDMVSRALRAFLGEAGGNG